MKMMMMRSTKYAALVALLFVEGHAFAPQATTSSSRPCHTSLALIPGQGIQLVAAFNAAVYKNEDELVAAAEEFEQEIATGQRTTSTAATNGPTSAARSFVSRVFSLPSTMINRHPHPREEGFLPRTKKQSKNKKDDVVLYPLVGFQFVKDHDRTIALPTTCHAACLLPGKDQRVEEVYGWFSPVCKLDQFSEDPCHSPEDFKQ